MDQVCLFYSVIRREHGDPLIEELNPGDALEPEGRGTGKATSSAQPIPSGREEQEVRQAGCTCHLEIPEEDGNGGEPWA